MELYYFTRTPPGINHSKTKELKPESTDIHEKYLDSMAPKAIRLYGNRNFLFTIPAESLVAWKKTGQLQSLLDMIVKMNWENHSVEQWKIDTNGLPMQEALVRETYFFSPKALGIESDLGLAPEEKERYNAAFLRSINSVKSFPDYDGEFKNPEVLLPFNVSLEHISLEKVIE